MKSDIYSCGNVPEIVTTPIGFAEVVLGMSLYPWQDKVLGWFEKATGLNAERVKATVAAPNGSGKDDRVIACLALWWVGMHPRGRVVITSKDSRQLDEQTMPAMKRAGVNRFLGWKWLERKIETPTGGKIIAFTTDEAGRAEGWHKEDDTDGPLLVIVNEAKSVPEDIFKAFDRCTYNALLYISSTGLMQGRFYDSHTSLAPGFKRMVVSLEDCPHIPQARIDDVLATYGRDHPFTKSTLFSEFMSEDDSARFLFPLEVVQKCMASPPRFDRSDRSFFCDFAAGGDENVLAMRDGNCVTIEAAWKERDTMAAVGRFLVEFRKLGATAEETFGDEGGLGKSMCDRFDEMGWFINRVNNGSTPRDRRYRNRGAEMWHETASAVSKGEVILPNDAKLLAQLTTRKVKIESDGRLGLVSKEDMRKAGLSSPDRADAVCGAYCCRASMVVAKFASWSANPFEDYDQLRDENVVYGDIPGMQC